MSFIFQKEAKQKVHCPNNEQDNFTLDLLACEKQSQSCEKREFVETEINPFL